LVIAVDAAGRCTLDVPHYGFPACSFESAVRGMLLSDTLVGAWSGTGHGPLGPLGPQVQGGSGEEIAAETAAALSRAYRDRLPVAGNPFAGAAPRGDVDVVFRGADEDGLGLGLEWMTATRRAFEQFDRIVDLDPPGGEHEVVLAFEDLTPAEHSTLTSSRSAGDVGRFAAAIGDLGRLGMSAASATQVRFHVTTTRIDQTADALLSAVPPALANKVVIAARPVLISTFRVLHPAGRTTYVLPG
jgi:hypothetical protein